MCQFPPRNCKPQARHNVQSGSTAWKRVGIASKQCDEREQFKSNQEDIATHIFINLVTHADFLELQGYTSKLLVLVLILLELNSFYKFSYVVS